MTLDPKAMEEARALVQGVQDEPLREALARLGAGILDAKGGVMRPKSGRGLQLS